MRICHNVWYLLTRSTSFAVEDLMQIKCVSVQLPEEHLQNVLIRMNSAFIWEKVENKERKEIYGYCKSIYCNLPKKILVFTTHTSLWTVSANCFRNHSHVPIHILVAYRRMSCAFFPWWLPHYFSFSLQLREKFFPSPSSQLFLLLWGKEGNFSLTASDFVLQFNFSSLLYSVWYSKPGPRLSLAPPAVQPTNGGRVESHDVDTNCDFKKVREI